MEVREIYVKVLQIVEYFLQNAAHFSIQELKDYDPSVEEIANDIKGLSNILKSFASSSSYEDENMAINAMQCCFEMERLSIAVRNSNQSELDEIFRRLEMHVNVP